MTTKSDQLPLLVAGSYINPGKQAKLVVLHVPGFIKNLKMQSTAFATSDWVEAKVDGEGADRMAKATVQLAEGIDPDSYEVSADLGHGWRPKWQLLVEPPSDGTVGVTVTKVDDKGLMRLKVEPVSRNLARLAGGSGNVQAATELAVGGKDGWFGLVYDWSNGSAANNFVLSDKAQPGKTYDVKVKQTFAGGHTEIITGKVALPKEEGSRLGLRQFTIVHRIKLATLGEGPTIVHPVPFGEGFEQTNTNYSFTCELKTVDPATGKPVKPTAEEADQLDLLRRRYHFVRHAKSLELHTRNPHTLRGNSRFQPVFIVTIFPVEDDASYSGDPLAEIA